MADEFPWTKREIVDAAIAGYRFDPNAIAPIQAIGIFAALALGRKQGRASPAVEYRLYHRVAAVITALHYGGDPNAAYDASLLALTIEDQLSPGYRQIVNPLDQSDARRRRDDGPKG